MILIQNYTYFNTTDRFIFFHIYRPILYMKHILFFNQFYLIRFYIHPHRIIFFILTMLQNWFKVIVIVNKLIIQTTYKPILFDYYLWIKNSQLMSYKIIYLFWYLAFWLQYRYVDIYWAIYLELIQVTNYWLLWSITNKKLLS